MITKEEAAAMVQLRLDHFQLSEGRIVISRVDEHSWGWMFFYNTQRFLETHEIRHALAGNVPLFVTKDDGVLHDPVAGSGVPTEEHLRLFELKLQKRTQSNCLPSRIKPSRRRSGSRGARAWSS